MGRVILLDAGPLGLLAHLRKNRDIIPWLQNLLLSNIEAKIPEIADYEVRRELLRLELRKGIIRLNELKNELAFVPITSDIMLRAADFWAQARRVGLKTADDKALDGDVILVAIAVYEARAGDEVMIATTNTRHFSRFVAAQDWHTIG